MKKMIGKKIEIIKEDPVAKALMGSRYRMKVKVSKKVYSRVEQRRNTRVMLKNENGPMRSLIAFSGLMGSFSAGRPPTGGGNWLTSNGQRESP
jgi:hypothetical protein